MRKSLLFFLAMLQLIILNKTALSYDYNWHNYREPYNVTVNVPLNSGSTVYVDLPADYIQNKGAVSLHMDLQSNFTYMIDGLEQKGFVGFSPMISVNGGIIFGKYSIPVKALPVRQTAMIKIKTKYLKTGRNSLEFFVGKEGGITYRCRGGKVCIVFYVHRIWFDDFSSTKKTTLTQSTKTEKKPKPIVYREKKTLTDRLTAKLQICGDGILAIYFKREQAKGGFKRSTSLRAKGRRVQVGALQWISGWVRRKRTN